jgi:hypothetical protein
MTLKKLGMGNMRNKPCQLCKSGKKFKKCECYHKLKNVISLSLKPKEIDEQSNGQDN